MPFLLKSLDAATSTGPGGVLSFDKPRFCVMQVSVAGSGPISSEVDLEGSLDGTVWWVLAGEVNNAANLIGNMNLPVMYARANLKTLSGGTSPSVTAWIAGK